MHRHITFLCAAGFIMASLPAYAQTKPEKPDSAKVHLGFGISQNAANSTASTYTISGDELRSTAAINLADALYGKLSGLTALKTGGFSGDEGYGANFNIRGNQTLTENGILILVDGVPRSIDRLTVDEVESVTVLKDAPAVGLLGYKGVNGAILVETRRGKLGKPKIDVSYSHKFQFAPKYADFVDAFGYAQAMNEARLNDGLSPAYSDIELDLFKYGTDPMFYPDVDWRRQMMKGHASEDNVNLAVHGGSENMLYYTMIDYTGASGDLKGATLPDYNAQLRYSKANIRANLDFKVTPSTEMSVKLLANFIETNHPASGSANDLNYLIYRLPALAFPVALPDGTWGGSVDFTDSNPVARIQSTGREKTHQRALYADARLTQYLDFITPGLYASIHVGYDNMSVINERHSKSFQYGYLTYGGDLGDKRDVITTVYGDKINSLSFSKWQSNQWRSTNFDISVNYDRKIGDHDLTGAVIYNTQADVAMNRYNTFYRANIMGYFNYVWQGRLAASLLLAGNGSNRSYPHKWSFSPSAAIAYNFLESGSSFGKIRASWGIQHSDYVPVNGLWLENYEGCHGNIVLRPNYDGNNWGSYLSHYPLSDFALETAHKYNLGLDFRFFKGLDLSADAYYNRRSNIMMNANDLNSWVVGRPNSYATEGKVDSYGVELSLSYIHFFKEDFNIRVGAMFGWGRNKIKSYIELPNEPYQSHIGQRVDQPYGLQAIGFFKDAADIASSPRQAFSEVKPGDIKYKDQNGDDIIDENDAVYFGYGQSVPETNYSFNIGAEFKRFGLNMQFQGASGMTAYLGTTGVWRCITDNNNLSTHYYENAWHPGADNSEARYPRLTTQDNPNNNQGSTVWYENIHWLKLRSVELYYRPAEKFLKKIAMRDARIFVKGENLFTASNMDTMDPEVPGTSYPIFKGITAGITVNF